MTIEKFSGKYAFLSNFFPTQLTAFGKSFPTSEHLFQWLKQDSNPAVAAAILKAPSPGEAKRLGRTLLPTVNDVRRWNRDKLKVMAFCIQRKFENPRLRQWLLETGNAKLIEGNTWGDTFWGVDSRTGVGENHLGRLLMELREKLYEEDSSVEDREGGRRDPGDPPPNREETEETK